MWQQKSKTFNKTYPKSSSICLYLRISKKRYGDITILSTALFVQCQTASKPLFLPLKLHEWRFFPNQPCTVQVTIERCQCLKTGFTQISHICDVRKDFLELANSKFFLGIVNFLNRKWLKFAAFHIVTTGKRTSPTSHPGRFFHHNHTVVMKPVRSNNNALNSVLYQFSLQIRARGLVEQRFSILA